MDDPHDTCDGCGNEYEIDGVKDVLWLYINNPECNHVQALCPHCGATSRLYIEPVTLLWVMGQAKLPLSLGVEAPKEMQEKVAEWEETIPYVPVDMPIEELPDLTSPQFRQLGDDIRKLEREEEA